MKINFFILSDVVRLYFTITNNEEERLQFKVFTLFEYSKNMDVFNKFISFFKQIDLAAKCTYNPENNIHKIYFEKFEDEKLSVDVSLYVSIEENNFKKSLEIFLRKFYFQLIHWNDYIENKYTIAEMKEFEKEKSTIENIVIIENTINSFLVENNFKKLEDDKTEKKSVSSKNFEYNKFNQIKSSMQKFEKEKPAMENIGIIKNTVDSF